MNIINNNIIEQFQIGYTSYPVLNQNSKFKYKVEIIMSSAFDKKTMLFIEKVLSKDNTYVLAILMLYENINTMIFNVLSSIIYCVMGKYVCVDYVYFYRNFYFCWNIKDLKYHIR